MSGSVKWRSGKNDRIFFFITTRLEARVEPGSESMNHTLALRSERKG